MEIPLADLIWFRAFTGLFVGLTLGSFATMLSYRIPRHMSIIKPGSKCPRCNAPLKPRDLIPIFSYILGKGRCHYCRGEISPRYLVIEIVTTLSVMLSFVEFGFTPQLIAALMGIVALITFVTINIERHKGI
jgi:leader peptidase (prepilin peptidase) / N-methyltransferase